MDRPAHLLTVLALNAGPRKSVVAGYYIILVYYYRIFPLSSQFQKRAWTVMGKGVCGNYCIKETEIKETVVLEVLI